MRKALQPPDGAFGQVFRSSSPRMNHALQLCRLYAKVNRPALLIGAVGAGKTLLATLLHRLSGRAGALVCVSGGELTDTLYADVLFGHVRGAYTGASGGRPGAIKEAEDGTLLLDDLALMPLPAQAALLRVMESRAYRPLGATADRTSTCRFLFASTRPLWELVASGSLLPDLRSRVGDFQVEVPSLADRPEDIEELVHDIARDFLREHSPEPPDCAFDPEAWELLKAYPWPGNVRELRTVVERAVVHAGGGSGRVRVGAVHLPQRFHEPFEPVPQPRISAELVGAVLRDCGGNQSEAARRLGVHRNTIAKYLRTG